jgi:hypothetical protein
VYKRQGFFKPKQRDTIAMRMLVLRDVIGRCWNVREYAC